jgi:hypothetical protein
MKATVKIEKEVDIKKVIIDIKIRYVGDTDDDDVPTDFPMLSGEIWKATVLIDEGRIIDWPKGVARDLFCKVCDAGVYTLLDHDDNEISVRSGYVPNNLVPGEYGDYVDLKIDTNGIITNWPKSPSVSEFFDSDD